jgi:hypothetical protein
MNGSAWSETFGNEPCHKDGNSPSSGAYRLNEFLPLQKVDLTRNTWREVRLVFHGEQVTVSVDGTSWKQTLSRPCFNAAKRKLLWMQNGGKEGIELDDIHVVPSANQP